MPKLYKPQINLCHLIKSKCNNFDFVNTNRFVFFFFYFSTILNTLETAFKYFQNTSIIPTFTAILREVRSLFFFRYGIQHNVCVLGIVIHVCAELRFLALLKRAACKRIQVYPLA